MLLFDKETIVSTGDVLPLYKSIFVYAFCENNHNVYSFPIEAHLVLFIPCIILYVKV